jgi:hypothetical protein
MLSAMLETPCTAHELMDASGLSVQTVRLYLKALQKAHVVHIAEWTEDVRGARSIRAYMVGNELDAKKPQPKPLKEACAKYRAKMKQIKLLQQMTGQNT